MRWRRGRWFQLLVGAWWVGALVACRCGDPSLEGLNAGFRVDSAPLDFGRVVTGEQAARSVRVVSTGRAPLQVELRTSAPFTTTQSSVSLSVGGEAEVEVVFTAPEGAATGVLTFRSDGGEVRLALSGVGVPALDCQASTPCHTATFDVEQEVCRELPKPEGGACEPLSACLDRGRCEGGECRGETRSCDDQSVCTADACSEAEGCVHVPVACPAPTVACRVATCNPESGCGIDWALDGTPCGPLSCVTANVCVAGQCVALPTPDGTVCSPKTLCQSEGVCEAQQCKRPSAERWQPTFSAPIAASAAPPPTLASFGGQLFVHWCASPPDAGCGLSSFTANGFERFTRLLPDGAQDLVAANASAVWALAKDGGRVDARTLDAGAAWGSWQVGAIPAPSELSGARAEVDRATLGWWSPGRPSVVVRWRPIGGGPAAPDVSTLALGGLDGGWETVEVRGVGPAASLGFEATGSAVVVDGAGRVARVDLDGGVFNLGTSLGAAGLAVSGGRWFTGAELGGTETVGAAPLPWPDAGTSVEGALLMSQEHAYAFRAGADGGLWLRAFENSTADLQWEAELLSAATQGRLEGAARVASQPEGVLALTETQADGGLLPQVHLLAEGSSLLTCPLEQPAQLGGVAFEDGWLYLLVKRADGWRLEGFDLQGLAFSKSGWPLPNALNGSRREAP